VTHVIGLEAPQIKNYKVQSPTNQTSNDEIGKKSQSHKKIIIKRIRVKIKIKNKLEGIKKI
jgi:hypothetical protein